MGARGFILFLTTTLLAVSLGWFLLVAVSSLNRTDTTYHSGSGKHHTQQFNGWHLVQLERAAYHNLTFTGGYALTETGHRTRCVAWYSTSPVTAYYRFAPSKAQIDEAPWYRFPDVNQFITRGNFEYRWVRDTDQATVLVYDIRHRVRDGCGNLGDPSKKFDLRTPIDFLYAELGFAKEQYQPSNARSYPSEGGIPVGFQTTPIGKQTQTKLTKQSRANVNTPTQQSSSVKLYPRQVLKLSKQEWIAVQRFLWKIQLGSIVGSIDGVPGNNTAHAIAVWQMQKGWPSTGVLTRQQLQVIRN